MIIYPDTWEYFDMLCMHEIGVTDCDGCCKNYPKSCECGGLIHHQVFVGGPDHYEIIIKTRCDKCGKEIEL